MKERQPLGCLSWFHLAWLNVLYQMLELFIPLGKVALSEW